MTTPDLSEGVRAARGRDCPDGDWMEAMRCGPDGKSLPGVERILRFRCQDFNLEIRGHVRLFLLRLHSLWLASAQLFEVTHGMELKWLKCSGVGKKVVARTSETCKRMH